MKIKIDRGDMWRSIQGRRWARLGVGQLVWGIALLGLLLSPTGIFGTLLVTWSSLWLIVPCVLVAFFLTTTCVIEVLNDLRRTSLDVESLVFMIGLILAWLLVPMMTTVDKHVEPSPPPYGSHAGSPSGEA